VNLRQPADQRLGLAHQLQCSEVAVVLADLVVRQQRGEEEDDHQRPDPRHTCERGGIGPVEQHDQERSGRQQRDGHFALQHAARAEVLQVGHLVREDRLGLGRRQRLEQVAGEQHGRLVARGKGVRVHPAPARRVDSEQPRCPAARLAQHLLEARG
jgi:hypothetical protein